MKKILSFFAAMLFAFAVNAADQYPDPKVNNSLGAATLAVGDGEVVWLDEGTYTNVKGSDDYTKLTKSFTVKAIEGKTPIVKLEVCIRAQEGCNVKFENIKFDASSMTGYDQLIYFKDAKDNSIEFENCEFYNGSKYLISVPSGMKAASITLNKCNIHDNSNRGIINQGTITNLIIKDSKFDKFTGSYPVIDNYGSATLASLSIDGSEFSNINYGILHNAKGAHITSCTIDKCYFHDSQRTAIFVEEPTEGTKAQVDDIAITNSTFAKFTPNAYYASIIDIRNGGSVTALGKVLVDHCTFYDCKTINYDHVAVRVHKSTDALISNSIFVQPESYNYCATHLYGGNIKNCITLNYEEESGDDHWGEGKDHWGHYSGAEFSNCSREDPLFVDPENGDFTLGEGSPALTAGEDGGALGDSRWVPAAPEADITWELNGGAMPLKGSTNEELWEAFKPEYNAFYASKLSVPRSDQPIDKAASFIVDDPGSRAMMLSETAGWRWLAEYAAVACSAQGWNLLSDETESHWRWVLDSFFNKRDKTNWPMGSTPAVFTEAGKEENWLPVYIASFMPASVAAEFTLVAPVKDGFVFGGWFDNAELTGDALTTIPANFKGTLYAKWNEPEPKTIYCKVLQGWWADGAAVGIYAWGEGVDPIAEWPGIRMSKVEGQAGVWSYDLPVKYTSVIFTRVNPSDEGDLYWGAKTEDLVVPTDDKNLFTITSETAQWDGEGNKAQGEWSVFVPETPAKFFITGIGGDWSPTAIKSEEDSYVLHLAAGDHSMKVTVDGTWETAKGFTDLTEVADGLTKSDDEFNNICFTLDEAGDVTVTYTETVFKLEGAFHVDAVIEPADRRIIAWDLKSVLNGNDYKFTYKSNIDGYEANLIFLENGVEVGTKALDAPKAGVNEVIVSKDELPAGILNWAIELKAGKVENFAEFTDASRGIYNFYLPQGIAVNNCTESDYFGHMYITEVDGASDGASDRTDNQKGGIFEYDLDLNELNPTNQGWLPGGIVAGTDRQEMKRITVDKVDGMIYFNRTTKIMKIDPADMTKATDILEGKEGITKVNSCFALNGVVYFMDNANITTGGTLKKIDAEGTISTIIQSTTWANADNAICGDGRGGLWIAQHRAQIDVYSVLTHINAAGEIDFKVVPTSDEEVKALFPSTNGQPSYRGQLDYNTNEDILAFGGNRVVSLFKVTYDAETGVPSLVRLMQTNVFGTKTATNIDGVAFDFAGNVYFLNATTERMYAYGVPTDANEVVVPAKSSLKVSSTATAIDETIAPVKAQKIFRGGEVLIIRDGKIYNMMGQIVR